MLRKKKMHLKLNLLQTSETAKHCGVLNIFLNRVFCQNLAKAEELVNKNQCWNVNW